MADLKFQHGGNIYGIKNKQAGKIIDFSANINPLGLPQKIKGLLYKNIGRIPYYPDPNAAGLVEKIANYWGISRENILLGNGSAELIYLVANTVNPKNTLIPAPTFSEYERAARCIGSKVVFLKLKESNNFRLNPASVKKCDLLFLCHPNNPTGNFILDNSKTVDKAANKLTVIDEAFMDFLPGQRNFTFIKRAVREEKIVVLRTFTKMFALAGLRIGYLVGCQKTIQRLKQRQPPWSTNSLAQLAAESILKDKEYLRRSLRFIENERIYLFNEITKLKKFIPYPSLVNFLLIKINDKNLTSTLLKKKLILKGILIRDCANFRGLNNKFIRVAVRRHKENLRLVQALKEYA